MTIGISQLIHGKASMKDFFQDAKEAGYETVEICMRKEGELMPRSSEDELKRIVELSQTTELPIASMVHLQCTGNLLASGSLQQQSIEETRVGLNSAAKMGIRCTLHTLGRLNAELYYDDAYENAVLSLKEIAKTAEDLNVKLAVELVWNGFLFSPLEMKRFLDDVGSTHIGFYFDPGNMAVFQYPQHWARVVGPHIKLVHAKDWKGSALKGEWTRLFEGEVDFAAVNRELRAHGYDGPWISEVSPSLATLAQTAEDMRKLIEL